MLEREFPILEFDEDRAAFIRPRQTVKPVDIPKRCVLCFFAEALKTILQECPHKVLSEFRAESLRFPVYELLYKGEKLAILQAAVGAPLAAGQIEELTVLGCEKYIACGSCGVLQQEIAIGHLIIPVAAVRDEGTSYHYVTPSREIAASAYAVERIAEVMERYSVPYVKAKTWTTDAFYRETPAKIKRRKQEGCVTVEMEASAYMAAAAYNGVVFGQILYAGDDLGGEVWDSRDFGKRTDIRERVLRIALDACLAL